MLIAHRDHPGATPSYCNASLGRQIGAVEIGERSYIVSLSLGIHLCHAHTTHVEALQCEVVLPPVVQCERAIPPMDSSAGRERGGLERDGSRWRLRGGRKRRHADERNNPRKPR